MEALHHYWKKRRGIGCWEPYHSPIQNMHYLMQNTLLREGDTGNRVSSRQFAYLLNMSLGAGSYDLMDLYLVCFFTPPITNNGEIKRKEEGEFCPCDAPVLGRSAR